MNMVVHKTYQGGNMTGAKTEFLLSYRTVGEAFELTATGPHENYYRDLKAHLLK
jgi:hypothetical protein